jgi:hypothetical protein
MNIAPYVIYNEPVCGQITDKVREIKYLPCNSASKSIYYLVDFIPYTQSTSEQIPVENGFLKLSLNSSIMDERFTDEYLNRLKIRYETIEYEIDVYRIIRDYIIGKNLCDSFVSLVAYSKGCTIDEMTNLFLNIENDHGDRTDRKDYLYYLTNSLTSDNRSRDNYLKHTEYLNAIGGTNTVNTYINQQVDSNTVKYRYNYLISESMGGNKTLSNYLIQINPFISYNIISGFNYSDEFYNILFQIVYACNILDMFGISHNDMHSGNVYVKTHSNPIRREYTINNKKYVLNSIYEIFIYDFDRSFTNILGENRLLNDNFYPEQISVANNFYKGKNLLKNFSYFIEFCQLFYISKNKGKKWCETDQFKQLLKLILNDQEVDNQSSDVRRLFRDDNYNYIYLSYSDNTSRHTVDYINNPNEADAGSFYSKNMKSFEEIIEGVYSKITTTSTSTSTSIIKRFELPNQQVVDGYIKEAEDIYDAELDSDERIQFPPLIYSTMNKIKPIFADSKTIIQQIYVQIGLNNTEIENFNKIYETNKKEIQETVNRLVFLKDKLIQYNTINYNSVVSLNYEQLKTEKQIIVEIQNQIQTDEVNYFKYVNNLLEREQIIRTTYKTHLEQMYVFRNNLNAIKTTVNGINILGNVVLQNEVVLINKSIDKQLSLLGNLISKMETEFVIDNVFTEARTILDKYNEIVKRIKSRIEEICKLMLNIINIEIESNRKFLTEYESIELKVNNVLIQSKTINLKSVYPQELKELNEQFNRHRQRIIKVIESYNVIQEKISTDQNLCNIDSISMITKISTVYIPQLHDKLNTSLNLAIALYIL